MTSVPDVVLDRIRASVGDAHVLVGAAVLDIDPDLHPSSLGVAKLLARFVVRACNQDFQWI
jgi:hypothetical protein